MLEFSEHGENAWLVEPDSAAAIAEGLVRLIGDHSLRRRLARGALRSARERDWNTVYDRLIADYRAAIEAKEVERAA